MLHRSTAWVGATAREIARAVRRGDTSATAVVADHLDSIRAYDRIIGAFREVRSGAAIAEAEIVDDQPDLANLALAGVPVAVKENVAVTGLPTWNGSAAARRPVADADHEVVRRLRGAGAVVVGVTRMPELGLWATTDDAETVTRNPWRTDRTPGGSSGGSAAAVAAGLVPIAHGNDGLGSIRIPAACCGIVGLKPGRGAVPAGLGVNDWYGLAENGILATTVADAHLGYAVLSGRTPAALTEPRGLRIAVSLRSPVTGVFADAAAKKGVSDVVRLVLAHGHGALKADPQYPPALAARALSTWFAAAAADAAELDRAALQPRTRRHITLGEQALRQGLVRDADRAAWRERCRNWFEAGRYDVLVTPALAAAPPPADRLSARSWSANMLVNTRYAPYAAPWNFAGFPGLVIPVGVRADGLPAAVQLVGPPGSELLLLALAGQIEQAAPWRRHAPGWPRMAAQRK
ncbi:amidase [Dactylosporangium vinaceum]|uniref:Amidase n=1 Tax=Dactylosporangium vinaceum TaxID=53362 RepID=A0ABV5LYA5_9ACTN|nr:amidase family protein [Dactylosporangium vinaceum]UAB95836.1 amidase [Dactylosporangium vinaceum]